jgi:hypothetical protein
MNTAFPGPYAPESPEMAAFEKENSPSPKGAASQGESGATAFGGSAGLGLTGPAKKGQGEAAKRNFGTMWMEASDEDKDAVVNSVSEPLAAQGVSLEGGVAQALKKGGPHAMAAAQRWGIDLNSFANMLNPDGAQKQEPTGNTPKAFKSDEASMESKSMTSRNVQADKAKNQKIQQRRAMGGFLMELGINILSSQRGDAGGAIGEGLKTTFVERRARGQEDMAQSAAQAESTRKAGLEASAETRAAAKDTREQEEHEAKKESGTLASGPYADNNFERQWRFYKEAYTKDGKPEDEMRKDFLGYYNRESRLTKADRQRMIDDARSAINDGEAAAPDDWYDMTVSEQNDYIKTQIPMLSDDDDSGAIDFNTLPTE